jgi:hypothetical protein
MLPAVLLVSAVQVPLPIVMRMGMLRLTLRELQLLVLVALLGRPLVLQFLQMLLQRGMSMFRQAAATPKMLVG